MSNRLGCSIRRAGFLAGLFVLASMTPVEGATNPGTPRETVAKIAEEFVSALIKDADAVKQDPQRGVQLAHALLVPHLDFHRFARWVLGVHWRRATAEQRSRFVSEFTQSLVTTYATAMTSFVDEILSSSKSISYPPTRFREDDREATVPMRIRLANGSEAEVRYRMHRDADRWLIYDVTVQGISLATTYRMSYDELIQKKGLDGVLSDMEARNRSGAQSCAPGSLVC